MNQTKGIENIKKKLLEAVGKYSDYGKFWRRLSELGREYDETLEFYHFDIWFGMSGGTIRSKAAEMLQVTTDLFGDMKDNAETELFSVLKEIQRFDEEDQKKIWEQDIYMDPEKISDEDLEEMIRDWEEDECELAVLEDFKKYMREYLVRRGRWR